MKDGRFAELRHLEDNMMMRRQLGFAPSPRADRTSFRKASCGPVLLIHVSDGGMPLGLSSFRSVASPDYRADRGMTVHFARYRDCRDIRSGPGNSEVWVRRPAGWAGRCQLLMWCAAKASLRSASLTWPESIGSDAATYPSGRIR